MLELILVVLFGIFTIIGALYGVLSFKQSVKNKEVELKNECNSKMSRVTEMEAELTEKMVDYHSVQNEVNFNKFRIAFERLYNEIESFSRLVIKNEKNCKDFYVEEFQNDILQYAEMQAEIFGILNKEAKLINIRHVKSPDYNAYKNFKTLIYWAPEHRVENVKRIQKENKLRI